MTNQIPLEEKVGSPRMLRGMFLKALCCGTPFLLVLTIPLFGISLSGVLWPLLILLAMLACPLGTYLMMRTMNKK